MYTDHLLHLDLAADVGRVLHEDRHVPSERHIWVRIYRPPVPDVKRVVMGQLSPPS